MRPFPVDESVNGPLTVRWRNLGGQRRHRVRSIARREQGVMRGSVWFGVCREYERLLPLVRDDAALERARRCERRGLSRGCGGASRMRPRGVSWFLDLVRRDLDLRLVNLRFVVETSICEYWYVYTTNATCLKKTRLNKYRGGCRKR